MPRRSDLETICLLGSGPIVIGQGCEFDYAGCQALKVLREDGFRTIVINPNPATIMTDPGFADRTYLEPLDLPSVAAVLERERPDALLATVGGQTALTLVRQLAAAGVLAALEIELIGADVQTIERAEDRDRFRQVVIEAGLQVPAATTVTHLDQLDTLTVPAVVRPAYTLGGYGGGAAWSHSQLCDQVAAGLAASPIGQVLVEESLHGWDEYELEIVRDCRDNAVVVCSIENLDPMGVHTGDSVVVAPQMTLSDPEYQQLRDAGLRVVRAVGVECGGANVQFARERSSGQLRVIEMNPRVSRSSALASKATGYPIAKVAARLAVGYTLDEITNDMTGSTPASFEPALDYVVVKVPRLPFDTFPGAEPALGVQMQAVGEAMGIGRTFCEAFGKAFRSREGGTDTRVPWHRAAAPPPGVHPWFRDQIARRAELCREDAPPHPGEVLERIGAAQLLELKRSGIADVEIAQRFGTTAASVRRHRVATGVEPAFQAIDSCAGEFASRSNVRYSTWGELGDAAPTPGRSVVIVGAGPNRIGQGIEFDDCCVQAARTVRALGFEPVLVNCNPATVSTDADVSARLYLEPLDEECVLAVCEREQPVGVCLQFGGQTSLTLAPALERAGVPLLGVTADLVDQAEDRGRFATLVESLGLRCPAWGMAKSLEQLLETVVDIGGYPVIARPSHVIGGSTMRVYHDESEVRADPPCFDTAVLVDRFLAGALELDVDALCDGVEACVIGMSEQLEPAGIHSGDSCAVLPPQRTDERTVQRICEAVRRIGVALGIVGVYNVQVAVESSGAVQVLETNPRASRTLPFVARATGFEPIRAACRLLFGERLADVCVPGRWVPGHVAAKVPVFSYPVGVHEAIMPGPRMRSTGEAMAIRPDAASALRVARHAAARHGAAAPGTADDRHEEPSIEALRPVALQDQLADALVDAPTGTRAS